MLMTASVLLIVTNILLILLGILILLFLLEILILKDMHTQKTESEKNGMCDVEMVSDSVREKISRMEKEVGVGCSQEELAQMRAEARRRKRGEER